MRTQVTGLVWGLWFGPENPLGEQLRVPLVPVAGACGAEEEKLVRGLAAQEGCGLSKAVCSLGGEVTLTNPLLDVETAWLLVLSPAEFCG